VGEGGGELLDGRREGDVAEGRGAGLAGVGEPVQQADQGTAGGLAGLGGGDQDPAAAADRVAAGPGWLTMEKSCAVMAGLAAASAATAAGVGVV
jgi:hypothetical protein